MHIRPEWLLFLIVITPLVDPQRGQALAAVLVALAMVIRAGGSDRG